MADGHDYLMRFLKAVLTAHPEWEDGLEAIFGESSTENALWEMAMEYRDEQHAPECTGPGCEVCGRQ